MPIYQYTCPECGAIDEPIRAYEARNRPYWCKRIADHVGKVRMQRSQTPVAGIVKNPAVPRRTK